jgi:hypothetical protein
VRDFDALSHMTDMPAGVFRSREGLQNHPDKPVVVFAVWEPILPTGWSAPGSTSPTFVVAMYFSQKPGSSPR